MLGIRDRVLEEHIVGATSLESQRRECMQTQVFLMMAMDKASDEGQTHLYTEFLELKNKELERARKIEEELSAMYTAKQKLIRERERKDREEILKIASRLEEVGGRAEIVEEIRKNA